MVDSHPVEERIRYQAEQGGLPGTRMRRKMLGWYFQGELDLLDLGWWSCYLELLHQFNPLMLSFQDFWVLDHVSIPNHIHIINTWRADIYAGIVGAGIIPHIGRFGKRLQSHSGFWLRSAPSGRPCQRRSLSDESAPTAGSGGVRFGWRSPG